jgi:ketosteroid isomerase-like protein
LIFSLFITEKKRCFSACKEAEKIINIFKGKNMTTNLSDNEKIVMKFIKMLEKQQSADGLDEFYHPNVEQIEFPNAILKNKTTRNSEALKEGFEKGLKIMSKQEFEVQNIYSSGDIVILEAIWKGTVSVPIGNIPIGGQMVAYFSQFFEFKDGKIFRQRNYDCFEPFN